MSGKQQIYIQLDYEFDEVTEEAMFTGASIMTASGEALWGPGTEEAARKQFERLLSEGYQQLAA